MDAVLTEEFFKSRNLDALPRYFKLKKRTASDITSPIFKKKMRRFSLSQDFRLKVSDAQESTLIETDKGNIPTTEIKDMIMTYEEDKENIIVSHAENEGNNIDGKKKNAMKNENEYGLKYSGADQDDDEETVQMTRRKMGTKNPFDSDESEDEEKDDLKNKNPEGEYNFSSPQRCADLGLRKCDMLFLKDKFSFSFSQENADFENTDPTTDDSDGEEDENNDQGDSEEADGDEDDDGDDDDDLPQHYLDRMEMFTKEQKEGFEYVIKLIKNSQFRRTHCTNVVFKGLAGTGKTMLLKTICDYVRNKLSQQAVFTATTGVSAIQYEKGRTVHSMFGIPLKLNAFESKECNINDYQHQVSGASVIICDDYQMLSSSVVDMIDRSLRKLMNTDKPFGGKIMVFGFDEYQVIPVVPEASDPVLFSPKFFIDDTFKVFKLTEPCRTERGNKRIQDGYFKFLENLGSNNLTKIKMRNKSFFGLDDINYETDERNLIDFVFPEELMNQSDKCARRAILTTTNAAAASLNANIAMRVAESNPNTVSLTSDDIYSNSETFKEYLNLDMNGIYEDRVFPDQNLELWKGALCMVMRTMYKPYKLINGTKVIVEQIGIDGEKVWVRKPGEKELMCLKKETFTGLYKGEEMHMIQFPLKLAYAMTVYKSQAQTLKKVGVDIRQPTFRHGQLYLAMSRVRQSEDIVVCVPEDQVINDVAYVPNIVDSRLVGFL